MPRGRPSARNKGRAADATSEPFAPDSPGDPKSANGFLKAVGEIPKFSVAAAAAKNAEQIMNIIRGDSGPSDSTANVIYDVDGLLSAYQTLEDNAEGLVSEAQAANEAFDGTPAKVPYPPASFIYVDVPVPKNLPKRIHQALFDFEFIQSEISTLGPALAQEQDNLQNLLYSWIRIFPPKVWACEKANICEMPITRDYETNRASYLALCIMASNTFLKLAKFFKSPKGSGQLTKELAVALKIDDGKNWEETKKAYEAVSQVAYAQGLFRTVKTIVKELEEGGANGASGLEAAYFVCTKS